MNYYEHHLGDYLRDTAHLSPLEDGIYRRLLDQYYIRELPLPLLPRDVYRLARAQSKQDREAVDTVLREFFDEAADGWRQERCDREIARFQDKRGKAKASADARWSHSERNANASNGHASASADEMRTHSERNAIDHANGMPHAGASARTPVRAPARPQSPVPSNQSPEEQETEPTARVGSAEASAAYSVPDCPAQKLLEAYHELCPSMAKVRILTKARQSNARARWVQVCTAEKWNAEQGLEWFRWYFAQAEASDFLTGRRARTDRPWAADFEWLMTAGNFAKVVEGKYR